MDILFHYEVDTTTGEVKYIGQEEIKVDTVKKSSSSSKAPKVDGPIIVREENKLVLSQAVVDMLNVCADCRIDIKYKKKDKQSVPVIGTDAAFGTKAGNKLTKSNTISFRGAANEKLAQYGDTFTLEETEDAGIFYLIGNANPSAPEEIPEEITNIETELDDIDPVDEKDLNDFDFSL